ncbi:Uncharacterized protein DBV15_12606 [Temnothorax longispinosus]|uniref:HAT C-terminal dimerisation domain-containing protein n=1 Tax=Temnothorax longispinosus TaxID=300112 RepID=A0A4S2JVC2_9HYME|nr:Uncharacterized protein DBV15_12606 [Temnothorax longispinosus]
MDSIASSSLSYANTERAESLQSSCSFYDLGKSRPELGTNKTANQLNTGESDGGLSAAKITNAILFMIAADNCPLSIVENRGFRALMKTTSPLYNIPSRKTITKDIELKYHQMKNAFRDNITATTTHTLTCDIWTDTSNQSYLGITDHYLTTELEIKNGCLAVLPLSERHTADYISLNLRDCLESFGIKTSNVTAMVTDSGANIKKAAIDTFGASKHIPCFAHTLSHVVPSVMRTLPQVENCVLLLRPIENVITEISGETYPTGSMAIPIIRCMEIALNNCKPVTNIGQDMKSKIIAKIEDKFKEIETCELLAISTILDPRLKKIHFRSTLTASNAIANINEEMKSTSSHSAISVAPNPKPSESFTHSISVWDFHDNLVANDMQSNSDSSELHLELRQYLNQPVISRQENPIKYWQSVKNAFPKLYVLAVKYLNVIATSVSSERLFSKAGALKTERRNRLSGKRLNMLLFLGSLSEKDWGLA